MSVSQTIVRQVRGGSDSAGHRFIILSETERREGFLFTQTGIEMTTDEVCAALVAHGISEEDALTLLKEAASSFDRA